MKGFRPFSEQQLLKWGLTRGGSSFDKDTNKVPP